MWALFKESGRLRPTVFLFGSSLFCVALSVFRYLYTGTYGYLFLNWNLFLAFLPWLLTSIAALRRVKSKIAIAVIIATWLLLFPNSLYILTDLVHLRQIADAPLWLDLIIVLSFGWAGLCYGFVSLMDIEDFLQGGFRARAGVVALFSVLMIYVAAFGIYIGRFWRWNSWDLFGNPTTLLRDIFGKFADKESGYRISAFTFLMGTMLNFMYFPLRYLQRGRSPRS